MLQYWHSDYCCNNNIIIDYVSPGYIAKLFQLCPDEELITNRTHIILLQYIFYGPFVFTT